MNMSIIEPKQVPAEIVLSLPEQALSPSLGRNNCIQLCGGSILLLVWLERRLLRLMSLTQIFPRQTRFS